MPVITDVWIGQPYPVTIALNRKIDVSYPEYLRQVTSGWCTSVLHAKYIKPTLGSRHVVIPDHDEWREDVPDTGVITSRYDLWGYDVQRFDGYVNYFAYQDQRYFSSGQYMRHIRMWRYDYQFGSGRWRCTYARRSDINLRDGTPNYGLPSRNLFDSGRIVVISANQPVKANLDYDLSSVPSPNIGYVFAEPSVADGGPWHYPDLVHRTRQTLMVSAWEQLAHLNENSLQNIMGAASFMLDVLTGRLADAAGTFSNWLRTLSSLSHHKKWGDYFRRLLGLARDAGPDLWLKYRYVYSTGVMDYNQAADWLLRQSAVYSSWLRFDANTELKVPECTALWHLGFKSRLRDDDIYRMLSSRAWLQGMEINPYVIWDFIPFSFVVDWLTGTGDRLQLQNDQKHWLNDFVTREICWSLKYYRESKFGTIECYYRFYGPFPSLEGFTQYFNTSLSVNLKRVGDLTSLVIGGG